MITFRISEIKGHVASPVFREESQCFVGAGRTRGGAREFIIRNQLLPQNATVEIVA
ncbi:polymorphic toxin type 10 domain-containing protein [Salinibacter ruber]|uniref:polymorphic toxin type 10 domain-containing protein n=1 Tax=Salinibacter ruber TaxID=146919 RepID=UPI003C6DE01C